MPQAVQPDTGTFIGHMAQICARLSASSWGTCANPFLRAKSRNATTSDSPVATRAGDVVRNSGQNTQRLARCASPIDRQM